MSAPHGSDSTYQNHGCRCAECRQAHAEYTRRACRSRAERLEPDDPRHGMASTYLNHRCRCEKCRVAHKEVKRQQRSARVRMLSATVPGMEPGDRR